MSDKTCPRCNGTGRITDRRRKITDDDVRTIRTLRLERHLPLKTIAQLFDVDISTISRIANGARPPSDPVR